VCREDEGDLGGCVVDCVREDECEEMAAVRCMCGGERSSSW